MKHWSQQQKPTHKYGTAKKTEYNGIMYASKFEAKCAAELDFRLAAGEIKSWEDQVAIKLVVNGYEIGTYNLDFRAHRTDGITELIEAKGKAGDTPLWRLKWKILQAMMAERKDVRLIILWQEPAITGVKGGKLQYQSVAPIKKVKE